MLVIPVLYGMDLFTSSFWTDDRMSLLAVMAFGLSSIITLIPCVGMVMFYRKTEE